MCLPKPHRRQVRSSGLQAQRDGQLNRRPAQGQLGYRVNSRSTQDTQKEHVSRRKNIKWEQTMIKPLETHPWGDFLLSKRATCHHS